MRVALLLCLFLSACTARPLTPYEKAFAQSLFGGTTATDRIRFFDGALVGKVTYTRQKRPRLACRERIWPEPTTQTVTVGPAAVTILNKVFFAKPYFTENYLLGAPQSFNLFAAMLVAHELTHVWQWQHRDKTGYSPFKAMQEHDFKGDPYLYDINTKTGFLDYAYEQQAAIVEEYVCCKVLDPDAPRTHRLHALLKEAFPVQELTLPSSVRLPWKGAQTKGICH
ncbi:hypothetical protein U5922_003865 [Aquicoccus sp. G2-2]|uniref:hypothetical protein n=1 Tax=Aquicoccus sp. G2-2 TaxID=3092120 RepID=UPI002AE02C4D|nr:hypothetical protein [Aquicoccus sp. G2-2]MEA1112648.1 hypothetical protein [Aquicoccus sp. G2-2]